MRFKQYVFRMRRCAMTVVLVDAGELLLLMRRHRFIVDRWVWELPGGSVDDGEDSCAAAAREVEEETGWHPHGLEFVMSCQPLIGNADYSQDLYLARGADLVGEADETAEVRWVSVQQAKSNPQIHYLERTLPSAFTVSSLSSSEAPVPVATFTRTQLLI